MSENRKYHFVKFTKDGLWYLKPECIEDVIEHFEKIFGREIKVGVEEYFAKFHVYNNWMGEKGKTFYYQEHPVTDWNSAVTAINAIYAGSTWLSTGVDLENKAFQSRMKLFLEGKNIYFPNGLACYSPHFQDDGTYYDENWKDELEYPTKKQYTLDDVKFMQWNMFGNKGEHWYATIEKRDVYDKHGNLKWDTRKEAEKAAQWFLENKINK